MPRLFMCKLLPFNKTLSYIFSIPWSSQLDHDNNNTMKVLQHEKACLCLELAQGTRPSRPFPELHV
jgi:hypothetical protein